MRNLTDSEKIGREVARRIKGEALFDEISRAIYSTAACLYQIKPLGVVLPRDKDDLLRLVDFARREGIPLTARGAGSGLSGQSIGPGIIVDFSRHMNRLLKVNAEEGYARVEPGLVCGMLSRALAKQGDFFPPDPSTADHCTLGGMLGNNSSGAHSVKYGNTIDYVQSLEVILSDGAILTLREEDGGPVKEGICGDLKRLIRENREVIKANYPHLPKNCSGYALDRVEAGGNFNLAKLFIGSEGTLGFITSATLRVIKRPAFRSLALFYFDSLEKAGEAVARTLEFGPSMVEMMDRRCLEKNREARPDLERFLPRWAEAELLVEFDGHEGAIPQSAMESLSKLLRGKHNLAAGMDIAEKAHEQQTLLAVRKAMLPLLNRLRGPRRVASFIEDAAVPPQKLAEYIKGLYEILDGHRAEAVLFGHAGQGNLHTRPILNLKEEDDIKRMQSISREVHHLVISMGGTVSGEHGDGIVRSEYLPKQYGPAYPVMREVKALLDPSGLMNPGKIIDVPEGSMIENLRYGPGYRVSDVPLAAGLHFEPGEFEQEIEVCHGCAECRTPFNTVNMCPMFKANPVEMATPRAKANFLRHIISGQLPLDTLYSPQAKYMLELCLNCKSCAVDCPSQVNIPRLWDEARARYHAIKGRSGQEKALGSVDSLARIGAHCAPLSNALTPWLGRLAAGIHPKRKLPRLQGDTFLSRYAGKKMGRGETKAALFVDSYINYYAPELGDAFISLLLSCDVTVYVPEQVGCGMPQLSNGGLEEAREMARFNLRKLASAIEEGYRIISLEPTATLCLRDEYRHILPGREASAVSENVQDALQFLLHLYGQGKLAVSFGPLDLTAGYHTPCHMRSLNIERPALRLLGLIPGLKVVDLNEGCCGMAGTFGLKRKWYPTSMTIGEGLFNRLREPDISIGVSDCSSCRMQMEHGSYKETVHPIHLLARTLIGQNGSLFTSLHHSKKVRSF